MELQPPPISKHEKEVAIRVLMQSRIVMKWVESQAAFFEIKEGTPEYTKFCKEHARKAAEKLIR